MVTREAICLCCLTTTEWMNCTRSGTKLCTQDTTTLSDRSTQPTGRRSKPTRCRSLPTVLRPSPTSPNGKASTSKSGPRKATTSPRTLSTPVSADRNKIVLGVTENEVVPNEYLTNQLIQAQDRITLGGYRLAYVVAYMFPANLVEPYVA